MSPEERQLLQGLFDRMRGSANAPRDRDAEQLIADGLQQQPYAPYLLAQTVIVQDQALQAANDRIQQLEQQLRAHQGQSQGGGSFLSGLFGGGAPAYQPPSPPQRPVWNQGGTAQSGYPQGGAYPEGGYPQQQQGGPWGGPPQQAGSGGFLRGALGTAAGVAGGVLMADSIRSLFSGNHGVGGNGGLGLGGLGIASGVPGMDGGTENHAGGSAVVPETDKAQDALQDANNAYHNNGPTTADLPQDIDQDQDDAQYDGDDI